ncbi:NACHT domain-containing NTPase [Trichocoleus desertorum AS-A10]|uniref:NACHT domain-containing NTPase n=1 Tax=Trichocoleus desertorum TaxID=1481672 RepID=UPI00329988C9
MVERSLQASPAGIQAAKAALISLGLNQQKLATRLGVTRQPISKFFNEKSVDRNIFVQICETLKLDWQEITEQPQTNTASDQETDIDALVQAVREQIKPLIKGRCGTMRVLDMTQPIALTGEQGIYTNVNILEKITGRRRLGLEELLQGCDLEEFDRFGLSRVTEKRVPGLEAVKRYSKLMVLGKPGAGKTTFLKYLAMQCIEGNFQADRIPVFITLKSFAEDEDRPNLLTCLARFMTGVYSKTNNYLSQKIDTESLQSIIQQGKLLILLDGLDEVREEDTNRVLRQIRDFSEQWTENQFVMTCRIAAKEYTFEKFIEVEVADFDDEQIRTFVGNWLKCREPGNAEKLTEKLITKLEAHKPIKELATNPLLLTLLCLEFEELLEFPTNRAELYDRGLGVLLSKWDSSRRIERDQVYKRLSLKRKEDLLSQVALTTFKQKDYFFKQRSVEDYIADYIRNLPDAQTDPEALLLDSEAVLKSIESQHGLLIERARGIYSFSHLTFQEYFVAREIVTNSAFEMLVNHLNEKRWREVLLLSVGMLRNADDLLKLIKQAIDQGVAVNKEFQKLLAWAYQKSIHIKTEYKPAAIRASYLNFSGMSFASYIRTTNNSIRIITAELSILIDCRIKNNINSLNYIGGELELDNLIGFMVDNPLDASSCRSFVSTIQKLFSENCQFKQAIQNLEIELHNQTQKEIGDWELCDQYDWRQKLRKVGIKYRDIGHEWEFSDEQQKLFKQYVDANKLLVECLNCDCYVSREVRQEIEDTLLLPIVEIEKYKAAKAAQ